MLTTAAPAPTIALRMLHSHVASAAKGRIELLALRRPDVTLRRTDYRGFVVDETVLTKVFPWTLRADRLQVLLVVDGHVRWNGLELGPLDVALLRPEHQSLARFEGTRFIDVEWGAASDAASIAPARPSRVGAVSPEVATSLLAALADASRPQREVFELAFRSLHAAGAPFGALSATSLRGAPSERDVRIARAIEAQLGSLATRADTANLGELAELSPRQLQRIFLEFVERYGLNSGNWRNMRNRLRLQVAAVLLGDSERTVAGIASEVGYASAPALARAFAAAGFPPPTEVRRLLGDATRPPPAWPSP